MAGQATIADVRPDLEIVVGAEFRYPFTISLATGEDPDAEGYTEEPLPLDQYEITAQGRSSTGAKTGQPLFEFSIERVNDSLGSMALTLTSEETMELGSPIRGIFDIAFKNVDTEEVFYFVEGSFRTRLPVTQL